MAHDKRIDQYRATLEQNFPALPIADIAYQSEGWDSVACRVNPGNWLFRFPKRATVAQRLLEIEVPLLNAIGPELPLAVPYFEYVARQASGDGEILPFAGYRWLDGTPLDDCGPEIWADLGWRADLGNFLSALHRIPLARAIELGARPLSLVSSSENLSQGDNWQTALEDFYTALRNQVYVLLTVVQQDAVAEQFEEFLDNPAFFEFTPTLLHGDLNPAHVLLNLATKRVGAIIDFGDLGIGDPAFDVRAEVLPYYIQIEADPTFEQRCRFYKKLPPLNALLFAQTTGDMAMLDYGRYEFERLWGKI